MAAFLNACRFNPAAGGTTDWTYSSAVSGYQSPTAANVVNGRLYKYRAESTDLSQWELGEGAYNTGTGLLARTNVLFNSSGTTSKINFSTVPQVAIVALKEDLIAADESNSFTPGQKAQIRTNIGMADGHIPGEASNGSAASGEIGEYNSATGSGGLTTGVTINTVSISIPAGDWDVFGHNFISGGGATTLTNLTMSISTTSATQNTTSPDRYNQLRNAGGISDPFMTVAAGPLRMSLASTTTVFLVFVATFTSVLNYSSEIRYRRAR
jgi:hypothetical protein